VKAITLWQPWASLIVDGRKWIETRSRSWAYVGPVAIHAGLKVDREACWRFGYDPDFIPTGAVLGTAHKDCCVQFPDRQAPPDQYGDFTPGRYGYLLSEIRKFEKPVPAKGHQGFWDWQP
jgi:activating signal cointegrator 1